MQRKKTVDKLTKKVLKLKEQKKTLMIGKLGEEMKRRLEAQRIAARI